MAGIYVHVPFCHAKCAYCDFYSVAAVRHADAYVDAVIREYAMRHHELGDCKVSTLYFGGGTPSVLTAEQIRRLSDTLINPGIEEFTIEVNPEDVSEANAAAWRKAGINRVSMGVQSLVDAELRIINRRHTAADALKAVSILGEAGFSNISLDLIYGLPGQTAESFMKSVDGCVSSGITHLSAYILSYEPKTLLMRKLERGEVEEASGETIEEMYGLLCAYMSDAGYEHYEISNFALPGMRSRHNSAYWDLTPYLGLGPAAHSLGADGVRRYHEPDIKSYLIYPELVTVDAESDNERMNDLIMISLRRPEGLYLSALPVNKTEEVLEAAGAHLDNGNLIMADGCLRIPESRWLRTDSVVRDLLFC